MREIEELLVDLKEIQAYIDLEGEPFDFGDGLIEDDSNQSESRYYKMEKQQILQMLSQLSEEKFCSYTKIIRAHENLPPRTQTSYDRKREDKKRMKYMTEERGNEYTGDTYIKRYYLSKRRKIAKKLTNKKVRKHSLMTAFKGGEYRRIFEYNWIVY